MAIFQDYISFIQGQLSLDKKMQKKSFTYKTTFSFKDLVQSSKSLLIEQVTLNDFVDRLDLFTKNSIH